MTSEFSVIVIGYAPPDLLAGCLAELRTQAAGHPDVEVLVVALPTHQGMSLTPLATQFPEFTWVPTPPTHNVARMRGLGVARSRGEVVALLEGDCVPAPGWLAHLVSMRPASAAGGAVEPGDFRRGVDWAAYLCEFGKFMLPLHPKPSQLPGANVVYRRDRLPDAARLEVDGFYETFVNAATAQGAPLTSDGKLVVRNQRTWTLRSILATRYHHGRGFASLRMDAKSSGSRAPYILLAMALPGVLVARVMGEALRRRRFVARAIVSLPWIIALSASWALGEFVGYIAGPGTSLEQWR